MKKLIFMLFGITIIYNPISGPDYEKINEQIREQMPEKR